MTAARKSLSLFTSSSLALSRVNFIRNDFFFTPDSSLLRCLREYATGCLITPTTSTQPGTHAFTVLQRLTNVGDLIERELHVKQDGSVIVHNDGKPCREKPDSYLVNANVRDFVTAIINDTPYALVNKFLATIREPLNLSHLNISEADNIVLQLPQHLQSSTGGYQYLAVSRTGEVWYLTYTFGKGVESARKPDSRHAPLIHKLHDDFINPLSQQYHASEICMDTSRLVIHKF